MKTQLLSTALILALASSVHASGSHTGGHGHETKKTEDGSHGHSEGHGNAGHHKMAVGMPGMADMVTRTIKISMIETDDGDMVFEPKSLELKAGETVRFAIQNKGELEHEFVLDTVEENAKHKAIMQEFPEMEHDDPNSVRLEEGQSGEIIWSFTNTGTFEFACLIPGHYESGMHSSIEVADAAAVTYTKGVVKKVNAKSGKVTIIHEELTNLAMPAMTMVFRVADETMLEKMNAGDNIEFVAKRLKGKLVVTDLK
mgnify:CR=1 FL=1|jgi:uncharacterized cupredoxin-like copper-binding protein